LEVMNQDILTFYKNKKILITGAAGYLATNLIAQLREIDCHIVCVDLPGVMFTRVAAGKAYVDDVEGDISDPAVWMSNLENVDIVFHLAAYEHKHGSEFNPVLDFEVNSRSVLHLLEVCRLNNYFPRIVFSSSSNLVGLPVQLPVNETFKDSPLTLYSIHKLASEKYLQYYAREFGQHSIILRLANVYGPGLNRQTSVRVVLNKIIDRASKGKKLVLYSNNACIRDYVWIDDVAAAFLAAACLGNEYATGQYYLIGNGIGYKMSDVLRMIADKVSRRTGKKTVIQEDTNEKLEAIEWRNFVADTTKFTEATGWKARTSLDEGIDRTVDYFLSTVGMS